NLVVSFCLSPLTFHPPVLYACLPLAVICVAKQGGYHGLAHKTVSSGLSCRSQKSSAFRFWTVCPPDLLLPTPPP
ncbi:hypothetical protein, partial [Pantoea sp.]|uniref:hypothetical protein n=1 Tax=Pantoea sp. TaxID=69393 RepID=UPI0028B17CF5